MYEFQLHSCKNDGWNDRSVRMSKFVIEEFDAKEITLLLGGNSCYTLPSCQLEQDVVRMFGVREEIYTEGLPLIEQIVRNFLGVLRDIPSIHEESPRAHALREDLQHAC